MWPGPWLQKGGHLPSPEAGRAQGLPPLWALPSQQGSLSAFQYFRIQMQWALGMKNAFHCAGGAPSGCWFLPQVFWGLSSLRRWTPSRGCWGGAYSSPPIFSELYLPSQKWSQELRVPCLCKPQHAPDRFWYSLCLCLFTDHDGELTVSQDIPVGHISQGENTSS